jgi:hypothetical protein
VPTPSHEPDEHSSSKQRPGFNVVRGSALAVHKRGA